MLLILLEDMLKIEICHRQNQIIQLTSLVHFVRLSQRLQEAYGNPAVVDQTDYDAGPNIVSVKKTVWKDGATMSAGLSIECEHVALVPSVR